MKNNYAFRFVVFTSLLFSSTQAITIYSRAGDAKDQACAMLAQNSQFFADTANDIHSKLVAAMSQLSSQGQSDLKSLQSMNAYKALKTDGGVAASDQQKASIRLAAEISGHFNQADNLDSQSQAINGPVTSQRDLYSYCLSGSSLKRSILGCVGGGNCLTPAYCQNSEGEKVQPELAISELWVSNVKHPVLTLNINGADYEHGGQQLKVDIDLTKLAAGNVSSKDLFKMIWPFKDCQEEGEKLVQSSSDPLKNLPAEIGKAAEPSNPMNAGVGGL